jgi:hypothetical protein
MRFLIGTFIFCILSACQPKIGSDTWFRQTPSNTINSHYFTICVQYGFKKQSTEIAECIQKEILAQKQRNALTERNIADANNAARNLPEGSSVTFSFRKKIN